MMEDVSRQKFEPSIGNHSRAGKPAGGDHARARMAPVTVRDGIIG
jgi:hypothetical protein